MRKIKLFFAALAILFSQNLLAQSTENGIFWKVSGKGLKQPSYLFGTYHLINHGILDKQPNVVDAFNKAKTVVVETVIDSSKLMEANMLAMMADDKVSNYLSEEDAKLTSDLLTQYMGVGLEQLDMLKPNALSTTLSIMMLMEVLGDTLATIPGEKLDLYFAQQAKLRKKQLVPLEDMIDQVKMLYDGQPIEEQAKNLAAMVQDPEEIKSLSQDLAFLYMEGDLVKMQNFYKEWESKYGSMEYLLKGRNLAWMEVLPDLFKKNSTFVAVGALHLPGEFGLITLLRNAGYTVEAVAVKN